MSDHQAWLDSQPTHGNPVEVILTAAIQMDRADYQEQQRRSERLAAIRDRQESIAHALSRQGIALPSNVDVIMRSAAFGDLEDRAAERERSERVAQREAAIAELEMAGRAARSHEEILAGYSRSCVITDARDARLDQGEIPAQPARAWDGDPVLARARAAQAARSARHR